MRVLAILGLLAIIALDLSAQNDLSVEGMVVNAATGAGIRGVSVFAAGHFVHTDEAGVFRVTVAKPGDYSGYLEKPQGYLEDLVQFRFHVSGYGSPVRPRLELTPPAILRGRVLGVDGKPARATVELGSRYGVRTDDDGYFNIDRISPGTATLLARPETAEPVSVQEGFRTEVAPTYYPSSLERSLAASITIRPGAELSGYEIRLQSAPVYRVSGVVLDLEGNPAPNADVQLLDKVAERTTSYSGVKQVFSILPSAVADTLGTTRSTTTADDGTFEFPLVRPGDWTIRVESDSVRDEVLQRDMVLFGSTAITLGQGDLEDVAIHMVMPFDLSDTVEVGDVPQSVAQSMGVSLTGTSGYFGGTARPDAKGTLRFEGVIPGRYLITTGVAGNYYVSVLLGSSDVTGQAVELNTSSPPVSFVIKRGGTLSWTVEQSSSWTVLLMPQNLTGTAYYVYSPPNEAARSELTGIPPGEYYAIALDDFNPQTMEDAQHLRKLVPRATNVRIQPGEDSFVQLKINHALD